jgi:AbrB family looped-hinge helix DNA binding protein
MHDVAEGSATLTSKGQVTLPVAIRRRLNLTAGTELLFRTDGRTISIERLRKWSLDELLAGFDPEQHRRGPEEREWDDHPMGRESV